MTEARGSATGAVANSTTPLRRGHLKPSLLHLAIAATTLAVFTLDLLTPLDIVLAVPYVLPVLLTIRLRSVYLPLAAAAGATSLTLVGYLLAPIPAMATAQWVVVANQLLAVFAIWATASLGFWWRKFTNRLEQEMTERARAERALAAEHRFILTILDTTDALIVVTDPEGRIVRFNRACEELTGYTSDEVRGTKAWMLPHELRSASSLSQVDPADHLLRPAQGLGRLSATEAERFKEGQRRLRYDGVWETKSGETRHIVWSSTVILDEAGKVRYYLGTGIDITDGREARKRAERLQQDLYRIGRLSELAEMASAIAHELNQPLTAMNSFASASRNLIQHADEAKRSKAADLLGKAIEQSDRAGQIVHRLRKLIGRGQSEFLPCNINEVVRDASSLALIGTAIESVEVEQRLAEEMPDALIDATQIQQVVFNLVRNALDALERSETRKIRIETSCLKEGGIQVTVADSGPGLAPEVAEQLFMPFVTTKPNGMGIGLSICRSIIAAHEGRIWSSASPEGGTAFHFILPAAEKLEEVAVV